MCYYMACAVAVQQARKYTGNMPHKGCMRVEELYVQDLRPGKILCSKDTIVGSRRGWKLLSACGQPVSYTHNYNNMNHAL